MSRRDIDAAQLRDLLTRPYAFGEHVDLRGHQVHGPLQIEHQSICGFDLSDCLFDSELSFSGCVFQGLSWFKGAVFTQSVNFVAARFCNDARFDHSRFEQVADFSGVEMRGVGCFDDAVAQRTFAMNDATSYGNLSLARSVFHQGFQLRNATLMGGLWKPHCAPNQIQDIDSCTVLGRVET